MQGHFRSCILHLVQTNDYAVAVLCLLHSLKHYVAFVYRQEFHAVFLCCTCNCFCRYVQVQSFLLGACLTPCSCVRIQRVSKEMLFLVCGQVRLSSGFDQSLRHHTVLHGIAVLAVVHQADAVASL